MQIISPSGGALNLVYQLEKQSAPGAAVQEPVGGGMLGKLDIKWRAPMGDLGRLQTQPIISPVAAKRNLQLLASPSLVCALHMQMSQLHVQHSRCMLFPHVSLACRNECTPWIVQGVISAIRFLDESDELCAISMIFLACEDPA